MSYVVIEVMLALQADPPVDPPAVLGPTWLLCGV